MKKAPPYHSALSGLGKPLTCQPCYRFEHAGSIAFASRIDQYAKSLPSEFDTCDVIYAEPPWRQGYEKFNQRAGYSTQLTFGHFVTKLNYLARNCGRPCAYIAGREMLRSMTPDVTLELTHNGGEALVAGYNITIPAVRDSVALIHELAEKYDRVGDFMAGYGRSGRIFAEHGKSFVLSDINPQCIGYIAENAKDWFAQCRVCS